MRRYHVVEFTDGLGESWFQVGHRVWLFFWRWDCDWPWITELVASFKDTPRRFTTVEDAFDRADELAAGDRAGAVRLVRIVERPRETVEHPDITYAMAGLVTQSQPTTETTTATKRQTGKSKKKKGKK